MTEHFISTPALLDTCHHCGRPILTAHSEGLLARADPTPITPADELAALIAGRRTYDIHPMGLPRKPYLVHRSQFRIRAPRKWAVVAEHQCPPGPHFPPPRKPAVHLEIPTGPPTPETPPY
ncbi:hypothetical protein [Microbispora sp. CA-102843]|uniref:hypothetical protein n=1 Tax=Microbispora sp. CA-102843 TaxID=3239952 RepID=UPI003D8F3590